MNNTFNYSFLVGKDTGELSQHKSFIPSEIISDKYICNETLLVKKKAQRKQKNVSLKLK